jgi:hypothetical protein
MKPFSINSAKYSLSWLKDRYALYINFVLVIPFNVFVIVATIITVIARKIKDRGWKYREIQDYSREKDWLVGDIGDVSDVHFDTIGTEIKKIFTRNSE